MRYSNILSAVFSERLNRFEAEVLIDDIPVTVHVRNTGRCENLLLKGVEVALEPSSNPARKTPYSIIAAKHERQGWVNIDSSAPNAAVAEWLAGQKLSAVKREYTFGKSRVDFYAEHKGQKILIEVKGCTLERDGTGYFPDAPTERGIKHLKELAEAVFRGYDSYIAFVIQMNGISEVRPNAEIHAEFAAQYERSLAAGVNPLFLECRVERDALEVISPPIFG
ncbi:MAG: DNA/RNA nuclease SfsA [Oscillospiraceae bacterium]|nr:DNA/RNA nuclease SfsA [Oscillospiraceae bacterium]